MKNIKLLLIALLFPLLVQAQTASPVTQNGDHVNISAPDTAVSGIHVQVPNAAGVYEVLVGGALRWKADGGGSLYVPRSNPAEGTASTTVASSGTIDTTIFWQRVTDAGAITGVILEAGTAHGQMVFVSVDKDASGSVTFAAEATSNVCSGTSAVLAAGEGALFLWDATDTCWAEFGT